MLFIGHSGKTERKVGIVMINISKRTNMATLPKQRFSEFIKFMSDKKFRYEINENKSLTFQKYNEREGMTEYYYVTLWEKEFHIWYRNFPKIVYSGLSDKLSRHAIEKLSKINISELLNLYSEIAR